MRHGIVVGMLLAALSGPASAEEVDTEAFRACLSDGGGGAGALHSCLGAAHAACDAIPAETPAAAIQCYRGAEHGWTEALGAQFGAAGTGTDADAGIAASINARYDLLTALLQCDRRQELGLALTQDPGAEIQVARARCAAISAALVLARTSAGQAGSQ